MAIGVFIGMTPLYGLHLFIALFFAMIIPDINKIAMLIGINVSMPPLIPLISWASYNIGRPIFGDQCPPLKWHMLKNFRHENIPEIFCSLFLGSMILGFVCALISYVAVFWIVRLLQRRRPLVFLLVFSLISCRAAFCQEEGSPMIDKITTGIKKAMEQLDIEKAQERANEEERLKSKLRVFIEEWLGQKRLGRQNELKNQIDTVWQNIPQDTQQQLYVYYLRDFSYSVKNTDLIRQDSAVYPYKAAVAVKELLYVERGPLIAEPRADYQYTVDTDITLNLQYDKEQDKFQLTDTSAGNGILTKGWPEDIRKKVGTYFLPES
jgi:hypothetical protein